MIPEGETPPPASSPGRRKSRLWAPVRWLLWALAGLIALAGAALLAIDTDPGHRFLADRVAQLSPSSGLKIRIGRIDGSLWGRTKLRDLRLYDPRGLFLEVPELDLDWRPSAWLANRLHIDRLATDIAILHRLPKFHPGKKPGGPILPGFDIHVGDLDIQTIRIEPGVSGQRRVGRIKGKADIRNGRALVDLAASTDAGDRFTLLLDAEPDRDRFDLDANLHSPKGGVVGKVAGTERPIGLVVRGDGTWKTWKGVAKLDIGAFHVVDLALGVREGNYSLSGTLAPSPLLKGKLQRLTAPRILVTGEAKLADRRLDSTLSLRSPALTIDLAGVLDLAESGFDGVQVNARLLKPPAMFPNMTGNNIRLKVLLNGPFKTAGFDYALTADRAAFDNTGFEVVRAQGRGKLSDPPVKLPVRLTARRVTGVGDVAGGILANLSVDGVLDVTARDVRGNGLRLSSDKLKGKLALFLNLVTGQYDVGISGGLTRYLIPGIGLVDVTSDLKAVPGPGGRGTIVQGTGRGWVRRFDNAFFASLAGGLPQIETGLVRGPDGILLFRNLRLRGPTITITGNGLRRRDGTFYFEGAGSQGEYGPFTMTLDGDISRPRIDLALARPMDALGLSKVMLHLDPNPQGFAYRANGGSRLGPFISNGQILLPAGSPATIGVAALDVANTRASGALQAQTGGFLGRLGLKGGGLDGELIFRPVLGEQEIEAHVALLRAAFPGPPEIRVARGRIDGSLRLDPDGMSITGRASGLGVRYGNVAIGRVRAEAELAGGAGKVTAMVAGNRGRAFAVNADADIAPGRVTLSGQGTLDGRPLRLVTPAQLTQVDDGWQLATTRLQFNGGNATLAGRYTSTALSVDAGVDRMPLTVLDIVVPRLALGGQASGKISYQSVEGSAPTGRADIKVRGLTRSGLVLSSTPVDMGLAAVLSGDRAVARAVVATGGKTLGRAQARLAPLGEGDIATRLMNAPLFAQLRYDGPADTLWRLTGVGTIDVSGPVAIGADVTGRLADPQIRGSLRTSDARIESAVSGTIITNVKAAGRFGGSRLVIDSFSGQTRDDGAVTGRGSVDFALDSGFAMDLAAEARSAVLINRDDIGATVTGPIRITAARGSGLIAGDVTLDRGRFRLGRAAAAEIPRLKVTEINRPADEGDVEAPPMPWGLDLKAKARNRLTVTGLGLDSEWRADLAIKGTIDNPAISGRADLVRGGYEFAGRRFDLERGSIRFLGETPPDPVLDIVAEADMQDLNATIRVSGTAYRPEIKFVSIPALPEDELLSRMLFGTSITNLSAPEAVQLAAAVASLQGGGTGLNPINAVRQAAGLDRLRILPADTTTGQGTSIAAGKYITRKTYVELVTDGQGYSATRIEFQITRWLSLLSSISTIGRTSANVRVSKDY
ncbi:autotransporter secretion inner membrane protein TamB [Sphingomonas laterariae]|uniref:Autotransporter secretion inner membrane protein TamB n=1 Tax=Edaphosphingomonas laterariae TaxID=861865 RepID=A0A239EES7_9SPHN|nr:translocation/assembly module TamB domain-containing protein [Sphingomonas laterariae]SNS42513.1 autotransporter secretion inner membrane protein TamB [Sphingomonas laterariae]